MAQPATHTFHRLPSQAPDFEQELKTARARTTTNGSVQGPVRSSSAAQRTAVSQQSQQSAAVAACGEDARACESALASCVAALAAESSGSDWGGDAKQVATRASFARASSSGAPLFFFFFQHDIFVQQRETRTNAVKASATASLLLRGKKSKSREREREKVAKVDTTRGTTQGTLAKLARRDRVANSEPLQDRVWKIRIYQVCDVS